MECLNCSSYTRSSCVDYRSNSSRTKFEAVLFDVELAMRCEPLSSCRSRCYQRLRGALLITLLFGSQLLIWFTENGWTWTTRTTSFPLSFGCCMSVARRDERNLKVHEVYPCSHEVQRVSSELKSGKQMENTNLNQWLLGGFQWFELASGPLRYSGHLALSFNSGLPQVQGRPLEPRCLGCSGVRRVRSCWKRTPSLNSCLIFPCPRTNSTPGMS